MNNMSQNYQEQYDNFLNVDTLSSWQINSINVDSKIADWSISRSKISNLSVDTLDVSTSGYIKSWKTSFNDTINPGWWLNNEWAFFWNSWDTNSFKYNIQDWTMVIKWWSFSSWTITSWTISWVTINGSTIQTSVSANTWVKLNASWMDVYWQEINVYNTDWFVCWTIWGSTTTWEYWVYLYAPWRYWNNWIVSISATDVVWITWTNWVQVTTNASSYFNVDAWWIDLDASSSSLWDNYINLRGNVYIIWTLNTNDITNLWDIYINPSAWYWVMPWASSNDFWQIGHWWRWIFWTTLYVWSDFGYSYITYTSSKIQSNTNFRTVWSIYLTWNMVFENDASITIGWRAYYQTTWAYDSSKYYLRS